MGQQEVYELLCILDFNNVRKRMSVILRKDDKITLYCKGADTTVYERLNPSCAELMELTTSNLNDFAQSGLRTLCLAAKDIDPSYYKQWKKRHHSASISLTDRDGQLDAVYEEIENGMILLGATAIEDKLQDGVPDAIANLSMAGIKIWVLTGDKQETAVNIGYSCRLLREEMEEVYIIDADTHDGVQKQLQDAVNGMKEKAGEDPEPDNTKNGSVLNGRDSHILGAAVASDVTGFALVINGCSLVYALDKDLELLLLEASARCQAVICCRVTPLQKSLVVELIKRHRKSVTLAIGDGANDVSMIKSAHIGVGISGQEGMQAVLASDFSLAQFRYLERLLLVHGRWSYLRMCKFLKYFFYKNFAFTLCHVWYAFYCGFSAQTLYDEAFISLYNVCYTSLPVLVLAIYDQDVSDRYSLHYPKLYAPGQRDMFFNKFVFAESIAEGIVTSLLLFMIPYGAFSQSIGPTGLDISDQKAFGFVIASTLIVAVTLRCAIDTTYWTGFNHFVVWGSILFYFIFLLVFYSEPFGYSYMGTATMLMSTAAFWLTMALTVVVLLTPVILLKLYRRETAPTLADKVRLKQQLARQPIRRGPRILRRASTVRGGPGAPSMRSMRSGYAFAHQHGFGELITTGSIMQIRPRPRSVRVRRPPTLRSSVGESSTTAGADNLGVIIEGTQPVADGDLSLSSDSTPVGSRRPTDLVSPATDVLDDNVEVMLPERQLVSACDSAISRLSTGPMPVGGVGSPSATHDWTADELSSRRRSAGHGQQHGIEMGNVTSREHIQGGNHDSPPPVDKLSDDESVEGRR
jgi:phospholipid-translocating ATPase